MYSYLREQMVKSSDQTVDEELRQGWWRRYPRDDIVQDEAGNRYVWAPEARGIAASEVDYTRPLDRRNADLFLRFARWPEDPGMDKALENIPGFLDRSLDTDRNAEAAKLWADLFGVLGLNEANEATSTSAGTYDVTAEYVGLENHPGPP